jgi:hypothetical protein
MTLPSGTVDVQLTEAEADALLKQIATQYNRLQAETKALDAALAQSRQHVLTGPVFYQQSRDRNLSTQELYEQLFAAQIRQKGQSQDLLQRIRESLSYIRPRTSFATVDALKARYGFGIEPLTATVLIVGFLVAAYVAHEGRVALTVSVKEGAEVVNGMIGVSAATVAARKDVADTLCREYTEAAVKAGKTQKEIDDYCGRVQSLGKPVTAGGAPWSWVIIAGLVAAVGGFFGGRVTK